MSNPNVKSKISRTKDGSTQSTVKRCCLNEPELTYFRSSLSSSHFCCFRSFFICLLDRFCFAAGASGWRISVSSSGRGSPRLLSAMVSASLRQLSCLIVASLCSLSPIGAFRRHLFVLLPQLELDVFDVQLRIKQTITRCMCYGGAFVTPFEGAGRITLTSQTLN